MKAYVEFFASFIACAVDYIGMAAIGITILWLVVPFLVLADAAITRTIKHLRMYPLLVDFIWHREEFKDWMKNGRPKGC